MLVIKQEL